MAEEGPAVYVRAYKLYALRAYLCVTHHRP
jgi:hypothetical protein